MLEYFIDRIYLYDDGHFVITGWYWGDECHKLPEGEVEGLQARSSAFEYVVDLPPGFDYFADGGPTRIYQWHITDNCDQRCRHCYLFAEDARARCISTPLDQLLYTLDEIERRCANIHTMPSFAITGGDPILHPQFWEFAEELHRRGFLWAMTGNPYHLNDEVCRRLRSLGHAAQQQWSG